MNEIKELSYGASLLLLFGLPALGILMLELYDIIRNKKCVKCGKRLNPSTNLLDGLEVCHRCLLKD